MLFMPLGREFDLFDHWEPYAEFDDANEHFQLGTKWEVYVDRRRGYAYVRMVTDADQEDGVYFFDLTCAKDRKALVELVADFYRDHPITFQEDRYDVLGFIEEIEMLVKEWDE